MNPSPTTKVAQEVVDEVTERILLGPWFEPFEGSTVSVAVVANHFPELEDDAIEAAIEGLVARNMLCPFSGSSLVATSAQKFSSSSGGQREHEKLLRRKGLRSEALINQNAYRLRSLILAVLMDPYVRGAELGFSLEWSERRGLFDQKLAFYLDGFPPEEIRRECSMLDIEGLTEPGGNIKVPGGPLLLRDISMKGRVLYRREIREELGLEEGCSILDPPPPRESAGAQRTRIAVFWVWQSDFKTSRNQVKDALKEVAKKFTTSGRVLAPVELTQATEEGDGAVRIDVQLFERIREADFVVVDITPVGRLHGRLLPNPNVLVELGYALALKEPHQLFLAQAHRPTKDLPGDVHDGLRLPFDIDHIRRCTYAKPEDLRGALEVALAASLVKQELMKAAE